MPDPPTRQSVLQLAERLGWPEIPACAATGHCWMGPGEQKWRSIVAATRSGNLLGQWRSALRGLEADGE